ncbi:MAG: hypothetical protein KKF79_04280 [Gammaproteobacteria bacterium]|nr:hypothetical protein [Gammaproteobacteria bacterium]
MSKLASFTIGLLAFSLTACNPAQKSDLAAAGSEEITSSNSLILRTYQVPAGDAQAVRSSLNALFRVKSDQVVPARVEVLPDQQLAVYASEITHQSVAAVLAQLKSAVKTKQVQAKISYWMVLAQPDANPQMPAAGLTEIKAALNQISQQHGSLQFELLERLELTSVQRTKNFGGSKEQAIVRGSMFVISQELIQVGDGSQLQLAIQRNHKIPAELNSKLPGDFLLDTNLTADQPDQLLVVGSNASDIAKGQYLYTIVRIQQQ